MNISEKINNSKYNMPLKERWRLRGKERVILFSKPNSRRTAISRCDVCKIYARSETSESSWMLWIIRQLKLLFPFWLTKFIADKNSSHLTETLLRKTPKKQRKIKLCEVKQWGLVFSPNWKDWLALNVKLLQWTRKCCSHYLNVYHSAPWHIINLLAVQMCWHLFG